MVMWHPRTHWLALVALVGAYLVGASAGACGVCVEDKMAATYDHEVVAKAAARQQLVVFCDVRGVVTQDQLRQAAQKIKGVDGRSVRASAAPLALSFSLDPASQTPEKAVAQIAKSLGPLIEIDLIKSIAPR